jgi:hypothetical protein
MADDVDRLSRPLLTALLDKSLAIFVMGVVLYLGYTYHVRVVDNIVTMVKAENAYLRANIDQKLDRILHQLEKR